MVTHYVWRNANPSYDALLRRANEARAAAVYGAWRRLTTALGIAFHSFVEARRRAARVRETEAALSGLSDRLLNDIGLARGEIRSIARAIADEPGPATLADLRRLRSASDSALSVVPSSEGAGRARPAAWAAKKPAPAVESRRAA